jgi:isoquinoline 1-oxidoreductase beta subunit
MNLSNPASEIAPRERYAAIFFSECFIDELARAAWRDPVQYRREMLPGSSRLRRVLDEAARVSGWSRPLPTGRARGISLSAAQGAVAAHVAEMSLDDHGSSRVHRIVAVIDCGGTAPAESARQRLYDRLLARWGAIDHSPELDVRLLASAAPPGHADDTEQGLAPAMANAEAALKSQRDRESLQP